MRISDWSSDVCSSDLVTFESGTDIDRAQMDTQNRLRRVEARLPEEVRRQGIQVNRANAAFLMVVALHSPNGAQNTLDLGNFATSRVIDELRRVNGVGDVQLFGRSEERRVGKECVSTCRSRWSPDH